MGGKQTKTEPLVFHNEPAVPIQFSSNFLRQLQGLPPDNSVFPSSGTSPSEEDLDSIINKRVQYENDLQRQRRAAYEQRSADQVAREADDLIRRARGVSLPTPKPEYIEKEQSVIDCYKKNPGRPLDCWREVEEFKLVAKKAEKDFVLGL
ncbi:hypothetical protein SmJEL517_g01350 [Synchytrium microbalum]|uniref:Uncharacterized protein n=1 Tax=Synchytrium microbalum TaxID=1806994 RepID=A0A507CEQ1_9FUNG|nr:uncharacterized protein SmJEL517_g01350 [Synchytrium microbalum]TPX36506.1 hypothetical protein SmJEL517_g01350 [Synchytrium microbalum]